MKLQTRLALVYCLFAIPILTVFCLGVYFVTRSQIYGGVDDRLLTEITAIESNLPRSLEPLEGADITPAVTYLDRIASQGTTFQISASDGTVLYSSAGRGLALAPTLGNGRTRATISQEGQRTRILAKPYVQRGQTLAVVETREPLISADKALGRIRSILIVGGSIALVSTLLPAYWLAGRVVDPIRQVSQLAGSIERTADFSRRLPLASSPQETHELSVAFNALLARIEEMMTAQRAFFADSSHELRRPLTILRTNLDILGEPELSESERQEIQGIMREEAISMGRLLSQLLLLARDGTQPVSLTDVSLSEIVARSVAQAKQICADHKFKVEITRDIVVPGEAERLAQMVDNLLENAHLYSAAGDCIEVSLRGSPPQVILEIKDSGQGMTTTDLAHAFDRFYRSSEARAIRPEGFGLGLAIVKHVAESHGGQVALRSAPGMGTTCTVTLPWRPSRRRVA
jgi:signal transduction histidine kinase